MLELCLYKLLKRNLSVNPNRHLQSPTLVYARKLEDYMGKND